MLDVLVAVVGLIALSPLLVAIGAATALSFGRPILFRQQRPGLGGKPFMLVKFRTMTDQRDRQGNLLADEDRLPPWGRFLRSTSLDELPELWNVLRGEMSLVGPRPLLTSYLKLYTPEQMRRHEVTPGITGWAQVNGRNAITWDEKFVFDVWYVQRVSFWLDIRILMRTVLKVVKRDGITTKDYTPMPSFIGSGTSHLSAHSSTEPQVPVQHKVPA